MKQKCVSTTFMRLAMACLFLVICDLADAQTTTEEWKAAAIKRYPTLNLQGSTLNKRFLALYNERLKSDPDFIKKPDWMMKMADELAPKPPKPDPAPQSPKIQPPVEQVIPVVVNEGKFDDAPVPFKFEIEDTQKFFEDFIKKGKPKDSDQFETREEREARQPRSIHYFLIECEHHFSYKIEDEILTFCAGRINKKLNLEEYAMDKNILENQLPIEIDYNIRENDAPNKEHINQNYLFIVNGDKISPRLKAPLKKDDYFGREQIALSVKLPRDTAKEVAPNLAVVCGVKFLDYTRSVDGSYINKRTISDPTEHYYLVNCIDAELVSLHLINQESKQQLIKWTP